MRCNKLRVARNALAGLFIMGTPAVADILLYRFDGHVTDITDRAGIGSRISLGDPVHASFAYSLGTRDRDSSSARGVYIDTGAWVTFDINGYEFKSDCTLEVLVVVSTGSVTGGCGRDSITFDSRLPQYPEGTIAILIAQSLVSDELPVSLLFDPAARNWGFVQARQPGGPIMYEFTFELDRMLEPSPIVLTPEPVAGPMVMGVLGVLGVLRRARRTG